MFCYQSSWKEARLTTTIKTYTVCYPGCLTMPFLIHGKKTEQKKVPESKVERLLTKLLIIGSHSQIVKNTWQRGSVNYLFL